MKKSKKLLLKTLNLYVRQIVLKYKGSPDSIGIYSCFIIRKIIKKIAPDIVYY